MMTDDLSAFGLDTIGLCKRRGATWSTARDECWFLYRLATWFDHDPSQIVNVVKRTVEMSAVRGVEE